MMRMLAFVLLSLLSVTAQQLKPAAPPAKASIEKRNGQKEADNPKDRQTKPSSVVPQSQTKGAAQETTKTNNSQSNTYDPAKDCLYRVYLWATILGVIGGWFVLAVLAWQTVLTRNSFVSNFRPEIILRTATLRVPYHVRCVISNRGGTKAHVLASNITVKDIEGVLPADPPYDTANDGALGRISIPAGGFVEKSFTLDNGTIRQIQADYTAKTSGSLSFGSVHLLGYVQYRDDNGVVRYTRFCRLFNVQSDRFATVDDPDYEYSD